MTPMFNVLIDTSVWLDLAEDQKQTPLLAVLEGMIGDGLLHLLIPKVVISEFEKNRNRVAKASAKSLSSHFALVKDAIRKADGGQREKDNVLTYLSEVDHRIPLLGGVAEGTLARIEAIFRAATPIEATDQVKARAADRALHRKAPCHHENKNSMADAVLFETYVDCIRSSKLPRSRFAFVTHNKNDFSLVNGNQKLPHADLGGVFSKIKSMYFINLAECLRKIDPDRVDYTIWEHEVNFEPRGLAEILEETDRFATLVWYNRHKYREWQIEQGKLKIVTRAQWEKGKRDNQDEIIDTIWKGALKAAKQVERRVGKANIGPWDDFEWGMINGKLSALRWMLGEDWDELYT